VGAAVAADRERRGQADGREGAIRVSKMSETGCSPASPDLPLHDIRRELAARKVRFGASSLRRRSLLKKSCAPPSRTGLTSRPSGCAGKKTRKQLNPKHLVFIDET
jgi:hypothetical protein